MSNEQSNNNSQRQNPSTGNQANSQASSPANSNTQKLSAKIKETWGKLSDAEVASYKAGESNLEFFKAVQTKYSISAEEAAKTVKKLDAECAAACSTGSNTGGSLPKAANT